MHLEVNKGSARTRPTLQVNLGVSPTNGVACLSHTRSCPHRAKNQYAASRSDSITLIAFADEYLAYSTSIHTGKTTAAHKTALREFMRIVGADMTLEQIAVMDCERFLAKKISEASPWTARKYQLALGAAFDRARVWRYISVNVWRDVKKIRLPEVLPPFFSLEEFTRLRAGISDRTLRNLVAFATLTGLRLGELLAMEWDWIDIERKCVTVRNTQSFTTKNKRSRVVPLCADAVQIIELVNCDRATNGLPNVFHRSGGPLSEDAVTHAFKRAVRHTGLRDELHFHSLRHYAE